MLGRLTDPAGRAPPAMADAARAVHEPDGDRHRQHHPQRRDPDARRSRRARAASARRPASCSGSSTPTRSCSPACCSRRAASVTASAVTAAHASASSIFGAGSVLSAFASSATMLIGTRALMGVGASCDHAGDAVDPHQRVPRPRERAKAIGVWAGVSAIGIASGRSRAACCWSTSGGDRCSS